MTTLSFGLSADHILLGQKVATKVDVLRVIGDVLLASGDVTERYVLGMFQKEAQYGTWMTDGIAMPHGTNEVKSEVLRNAIVLVQLPDGVDWGKGRMVRLAIGLAGKGDEQHMEQLASLAGVLQQKELVERLATTQDKNEIIEILTRYGHMAQEETQ
jgi:mannitol/fructose-specific phosphotransferase system IIA component